MFDVACFHQEFCYSPNEGFCCVNVTVHTQENFHFPRMSNISREEDKVCAQLP